MNIQVAGTFKIDWREEPYSESGPTGHLIEMSGRVVKYDEKAFWVQRDDNNKIMRVDRRWVVKEYHT